MIAIAIGAVILLWAGIASWKTMFSVFAGGALLAWVFNVWGPEGNAGAAMPWYPASGIGRLLFQCRVHGYRPVTSARTGPVNTFTVSSSVPWLLLFVC